LFRFVLNKAFMLVTKLLILFLNCIGKSRSGGIQREGIQNGGRLYGSELSAKYIQSLESRSNLGISISRVPLVEFSLGMNLRLSPSRDLMLNGNFEVEQRLWNAILRAWVKYRSAGILPVMNCTFFLIDNSGLIGNPNEALILSINCDFWTCRVCFVSAAHFVSYFSKFLWASM